MHLRTIQFKIPAGLTITGDVMGPESGQPVLLLHGGGQTRGTWKNTIETLAGLGYRAYSLDARGHGDSDYDPQGNYTPDDFSQDLLSVIDQIGQPPILIGASLGGVISLLTAGEGGPAVAKGLVLVDVAARTNPYGVARVLGFMSAHPNGFANVSEAADAVAVYAPERPRPSSTAGLERNLRKLGERYYWHWDQRFLDSWHPAHKAALGRLEKAAQQLSVPTMIVHAAESDVLGEDEIRHLQGLVPHAEYVRVENAGHMVVGDKNSEFNQAILAFLAKHSPIGG
ncbi:alpha/beta hydrolase [Polaromonas hydrogenivorans]|uniref:Alpha/beta hydrolase n=1 Tax=Polaromonas hydrogenivorans TaxID=335476 RepID=A0AAU7M038_9BURK